MNQARAEAVKLIEKIPEDRLPFVHAVLRAVLEEEEEEKTIIEPCYDDELTDDDRAEIAAAQADIQAGRVRDWAEVKKEFGL